MTILAAIMAIQNAAEQVTGVKSAPDYPAPGELPEVITHLTTGEITPGNPAGSRTELNAIMVELHISEGGGRAAAFAALETIHPLLVAALTSDVTFGGALAQYSTVTFTTAASVSMNGTNTIARFYTLNGCKVIA